MKKQLLALCIGLSIGQCHSMNQQSNELTMLLDCYNQINNKLSPQTLDNQLVKLNNIVLLLTGQAIQKSKNLIGQEDKSLVAAAHTIRNITIHTINLYKGIKINSKLLQSNTNIQIEYQQKINNLIITLSKELNNINVYHTTSSKKEAQRILTSIISFLRNYLLKDVETELIFHRNQGLYAKQKKFMNN